MVLKSWKKVNNFSIFFTLVCIKQLEVACITCYAGIYGNNAFLLSAFEIDFVKALIPVKGH
jgi:hypothetical protein